MKYLALGDSYTIGEAVHQTESFPFQLVNQLNQHFSINQPKVIAKTGWTTDELITAISQENLTETYDFVTLLIGVNNQYRGYPINQYELEFKQLLDLAIGFAGGKKESVFVVSIPDWGVTPFGLASGRDQQQISKELDQYNHIAQKICIENKVDYTDITQKSKLAASNNELSANDGLHPSPIMYADWVNSLYPKVKAALTAG
jgi:lysophospholipase L1-like esterase